MLLCLQPLFYKFINVQNSGGWTTICPCTQSRVSPLFYHATCWQHWRPYYVPTQWDVPWYTSTNCRHRCFLLHKFPPSPTPNSSYKVSQEECARLRESVPYVKLYRYNPKHLYPKLNGYGANSQRKVWASSVSTYCMPSVTSYLSNAPARQLDIVMQWPWRVRYSAR